MFHDADGCYLDGADVPSEYRGRSLPSHPSSYLLDLALDGEVNWYIRSRLLRRLCGGTYWQELIEYMEPIERDEYWR
jgi:hypothetical protein